MPRDIDPNDLDDHITGHFGEDYDTRPSCGVCGELDCDCFADEENAE